MLRGLDRRAGSPAAIRRAVTTTAWAVVVVAVVLGAAMRLWYLFHDPLNGDGAGVGLMAQRILDGHLNAFFPGQVYGGIEAYPTAAVFGLFGQSVTTVSLTPILLSAAAAVLTWRVGLRLVGDGALAALAGALVWAAPLAAVLNSTLERGFRGAVLACGLGALLVALRILDGRRSTVELAALGLLLGLGWWASPEIVYFVPPVAVVLGAAARRALARTDGDRPDGDHPPLAWVARLGAGLAALGLGALPWLWANAGSGFASLHRTAFAGGRVPSTFGSRLATFFHHALPMQLNLVEPISTYPHAAGPALTAAALVVIVVAAVVAVHAGVRGAALVAGLAAFPFLYALQPGTWYWQDGRYAVFVVPMVALTTVLAADHAPALLAGSSRLSHRQHPTPRSRRPNAPGRPRTMPRLAVALGVLGLSALSVVSLRGDAHWSDLFAHGLLSHWGNPEAPTEHAVAVLERAGVRPAYADYWVAYDLDFLSGGRLAVTTIAPDIDLAPDIHAAVGSSAHPAWIFVPAGERHTGWWQFGESTAIYGPGPTTESSFRQELDRLGIGYRVVDAGVLQAVVPDGRVTPATIGLAR